MMSIKKNIGVILNLAMLFEMYNTLQKKNDVIQQKYDALQQNYDALQQNYDALQQNYDALLVTFENKKKDIISDNDIINDTINDIINNIISNNDTINYIISNNDTIRNNDISNININNTINNDTICNSNELVDFEFIELKTHKFEILSCNTNIKCDSSIYKIYNTIWNNFTKTILYS